MTDETVFKYYEIPAQESPTEFFKWCINKKLYKYDGGMNFISRMNAVYSGLEPFQGISAIIAYKKSRPVGIVLCEHRNKDKIKSPEDCLDFKFYNLGFLNVYIKTSHRKNGLATQLVNKMEIFRLSAVKSIYKSSNKNLSPVFICRGLAKKIVQDKSRYVFAIGSEFNNKGSDLELSNIAFYKNQPDLKNGYEVKLKEKVNFNALNAYEISPNEKMSLELTKSKGLKFKM